MCTAFMGENSHLETPGLDGSGLKVGGCGCRGFRVDVQYGFKVLML